MNASARKKIPSDWKKSIQVIIDPDDVIQKASARAVPFAVAVFRRFAHIAGGGRRELAEHRLEKPTGGTGGRPKKVSRGRTALGALPKT